MPYRIVETENGFNVVNTETGKTKNAKPYIKRDDALKYQRALMAAESETTKAHDGVMVALMLPPSVAEMIAVNGQELPLGVEALPPYEMHVTLCYLGDALQVDNQKLNILKAVSDYAQVYPAISGRLNGYGRFVETHLENMECLYLNFDSPGLTAFRMGLHEMLRGYMPLEENHGYTPHVTLAYVPKGTDLKIETPLPLDVTIDAVTVAWGEERYSFALGSVLKESRLKELFRGLLDFFGFKKKSEKSVKDNSFTVFKDDDGAYRWVLISSNAYRDRDGEIVSTKALQDDVDRADSEKDYGPLRWWHLPGVDIGKTDFNMLHGRMLIESGTFNTPEIAAAVAEKADDLQASIAFRHPMNEPNAAGVFDHIRRFERSLVPKGRASNGLTSLAVTKGENMSTLAEKISAFKALLKDDELANHILQQAETKEKEADAAGLAFKETTSTTPDPSTLKQEVEVETETEKVDPEQARMAAIVEKCMTPYMEKMGGMVEEMKAMYSKTKDDTAVLEQERQTTLKAYGDKLTLIETQQAALAKTQQETIATLKEAQKEVKTLMGDLPKGVGAFIASTSKETEVDESDERLKAAPSQDPTVNNDFMSFILPQAHFAPQGQR